MSKIIIISDSTCDLNNLAKERNVEILPLKVCFNEEMYKDVLEITTPEMFKKVEETNIMPKTAAATIDEFVNLFNEKVGKEGNDVIFTGIGGCLSSTLQNAIIAKNELDDEVAKHVYVLDSGNLSTGIGLTVLKMCDLRDQGLSAAEIVAEAEKIVPCVRAQFAVKNLEYLHKGGRCSGTTKIIGTLLRIRPILRVFQGKINVAEKVFGIRFEKALDFQIQDVVNNLKHIDPSYLFITHSETDEDAKYVLEHLPAEVKKHFKNIYVTKSGCVISAHCGKGTLGLLYIKDQPLVDDK